MIFQTIAEDENLERESDNTSSSIHIASNGHLVQAEQKLEVVLDPNGDEQKVLDFHTSIQEAIEDRLNKDTVEHLENIQEDFEKVQEEGGSSSNKLIEFSPDQSILQDNNSTPKVVSTPSSRKSTPKQGPTPKKGCKVMPSEDANTIPAIVLEDDNVHQVKSSPDLSQVSSTSKKRKKSRSSPVKSPRRVKEARKLFESMESCGDNNEFASKQRKPALKVAASKAFSKTVQPITPPISATSPTPSNEVTITTPPKQGSPSQKVPQSPSSPLPHAPPQRRVYSPYGDEPLTSPISEGPLSPLPKIPTRPPRDTPPNIPFVDESSGSDQDKISPKKASLSEEAATNGKKPSVPNLESEQSKNNTANNFTPTEIVPGEGKSVITGQVRTGWL